MADLFTQKDIVQLFSNKFVLMLGDSNMRAIYKDLLYLLNRGKMTPASSFRGRHDNPFCGDKLIKVTKPSRGRGYYEVREFEDNRCNILIRYQFITRVYDAEVKQLCLDLEKGEVPTPQILIINSCMWDLTRWGPYQEETYKINIIKLFNHLRVVLPDDTLVIWTTTPPVSSERVKGGVLIKQLDFIQHSMRFMFMEANSFVRQACVAFDFDILDLHYWMRFQLNRRTIDGLHWEPHAMRFITNQLLTHISLAFEEPLPNKCANRSLDNTKKKATEALNGCSVDFFLSKDMIDDIFEIPSAKKINQSPVRFPGLKKRKPSCKNIKVNSKKDLKTQQVEVENALERITLRARRRLTNSQYKESMQESSKEKNIEMNRESFKEHVFENSSPFKQKLKISTEKNIEKANEIEKPSLFTSLFNIDDEFIRAKFESFLQEEAKIDSKKNSETQHEYANISHRQSSTSGYQQSSSNLYPEIDNQDNDSWDSQYSHTSDGVLENCEPVAYCGVNNEGKLRTIRHEEFDISQNKNLRNTVTFCEENNIENYDQSRNHYNSSKEYIDYIKSTKENEFEEKIRKIRNEDFDISQNKNLRDNVRICEENNIENYKQSRNNYNFIKAYEDHITKQNEFDMKRVTNKTAELNNQPSSNQYDSKKNNGTEHEYTNISYRKSSSSGYQQSSRNLYPEIDIQQNNSWNSWIEEKLKKIRHEEFDISQNKNLRDTVKFYEKNNIENYEQSRNLYNSREAYDNYISNQNEFDVKRVTNNTAELDNQPSSSANYSVGQNGYKVNPMDCPSNQYASISSSQFFTKSAWNNIENYEQPRNHYNSSKAYDYITNQNEFDMKRVANNTAELNNQPSSSVNYSGNHNGHNVNSMDRPSNQLASISSSQLCTQTAYISQSAMPQNITTQIYSQTTLISHNSMIQNLSTHLDSKSAWFSQTPMPQNISSQISNNQINNNSQMNINPLNLPLPSWAPTADDNWSNAPYNSENSYWQNNSQYKWNKDRQ